MLSPQYSDEAKTRDLRPFGRSKLVRHSGISQGRSGLDRYGTVPLSTMNARPLYRLLPLGLATLWVAPVFAQNSTSDAPRLSLAAEEPTGVFYDSDTISPQTPILFTVKVENPAREQRQIEVEWRVTDSAGTVRWKQGAKFSVEAGGSIIRRQLFDAPGRGGYLLNIHTVSKRKGPDAEVSTNLPFAVAPAPNPGAISGARPRSFFVLTTPTSLTDTQLNFYSRLGARVLRSNIPFNPAQPDWEAVENQLGERLKRNLSSIALLDLGNESNRKNEAFWARQVPASLAKYSALTTWELAGDVAPADLDAWAQVARSRRSDLTLLGPLSSLPPTAPAADGSAASPALDGATFEWPAGLAPEHPEALRRLWLAGALSSRNAGLTAFHLRREHEDEQNESPLQAAGELTADYLSAIEAGASTMAEELAPPSDPNTSVHAMARGVAFSMLSRTLEDASFREELFPKSAAFEGALFRAPRGSIAVVYAPLGDGQMTLRVGPAQVFDLFGNPLATSQDGKIQFKLGAQPVYIAADVETDVLSYALKTAKTDGFPRLAVQVLPLSRELGVSGPGSATVRVRVQNVGLTPASGRIELDAPKGWKIASEKYSFDLGEGESRTYEYRATTTKDDPKWTKGVPFSVSVKGDVKGTWKMDVPVASARNATPGNAPEINGNLDDWKGANWMDTLPNAAGARGKVALKWDATNLYVAAQVKEDAITPRNPEASNYDFWNGYDAIQLGFGLTNGPETLPVREPFRDSDRAFLLTPFHVRSAGGVEGRVLKLWSPETPYGSLADHVRWGGAVAGAACAIGRDEAGGVSTYEAKIPLSALPDLNPQELAQRDNVVRFGFIIHNGEGTALDWGKSVGNFDWWDNPTTFLPSDTLTSALRATLGFTLSGEVNAPAVSVPAPLSSGGQPVPVNPPVTPNPTPATPPSITPVTPPPTIPPSVIAPTPTPPPAPVPTPQPKPTPKPAPVDPGSNPIPNLPPPSGPLTDGGTNSAPPSTPVPPAPPTNIPPFVPPPADTTPPRHGVGKG